MNNIDFSALRRQLEKQKQIIEERLRALNIMEEMVREGRTGIKHFGFPERKKQEYSSMTLRDACKSVLSNSTQAMNRKEVTGELIRGGYHFQTNKPVESVGTILRNLANDDEIELVKIKPGRNAYKAKEISPILLPQE